METQSDDSHRAGDDFGVEGINKDEARKEWQSVIPRRLRKASSYENMHRY